MLRVRYRLRSSAVYSLVVSRRSWGQSVAGVSMSKLKTPTSAGRSRVPSKLNRFSGCDASIERAKGLYGLVQD